MTLGNSPAPDGGATFVLALDIGTSSVRAMLFDLRGDAVPDVHIQQAYPLTTSTLGEVTVDADLLTRVVGQCIDAALAAAGPRATRIVAVACDTFWHSLLAVDAAGHPLTPVITWADTRARDASAALKQTLDTATVHRTTGAPIHTSYWPARIRWLAETQPDVLRNAAGFMSFGEYLHRRLLGRSVCSLCMASGTGLLVTQSGEWDWGLTRYLGIRPDQLPALGDLADAVNGLTPEYSDRWPALRAIPWFPAIGDGAAANVGSGCADARFVAMTVGTSSALRVITPTAGAVPPPGLWLYLLDKRRAVLGGALSEGGNLLAWLERALRLDNLLETERAAAAIPPDSHGLTVLPFLAGERSLGWHGEARATFAGISVHTMPTEMFLASLEALAYRLAAVYERLNTALAAGAGGSGQRQTREVIGSGGSLLGSSLFQQIVADALGVPLHPSLDSEASARGAAVLALEALGYIKNPADVAPRLGPALQPDAQRTAVYRAGMLRQEDLYRRLLG